MYFKVTVTVACYKMYLILTFTKNIFFICLNLAQHYISLKFFHSYSSRPWFYINVQCTSVDLNYRLIRIFTISNKFLSSLSLS